MRERADDVSCLREPGAQMYANTNVDRQVGKTIKTLSERFDWMNISWSYTFHRIYKYRQGRIGHLAILANARGAGPFCLMWASQIF